MGPLGSGSSHRTLPALTSLSEHFLASSEQETLSFVDDLLVSC